MENVQEKNVLAYCSTCQQTLHLLLRSGIPEADYAGNLSKITFVHEGLHGEAAHALMMHLDENFTVRRAEVTDITLADSTSQDDEFTVTTFCQICQKDLDVPIRTQRFEQAVKTRGFYKHLYIHGDPFHALVTLIDAQKQVRRAEITDLKFDSALEKSKLIPQVVSPEKYILLDRRKMDSRIFEALFLFDRRSKTVVEFYERDEYSADEIAIGMERKIKPLEQRGQTVMMLSFLQDEKDYVYIMFDYNVVLIGINFNKTYVPWLETLVQTLLLETETPNTLGIEIFLQIMERNLTSPRIHEIKIWSDILYSPLYSLQFSYKNQRQINQVIRLIKKRFPNVGSLFHLCAEGKCTLLEVLNTETGLQNFEEFLELTSYLELKKLF